jgi:tetratricopeptide (TPR) repeat protein
MRVGFLVALLGALAIAAIGMIASDGRDPDPSRLVAPVAHAKPDGARAAAIATRHVEPRTVEAQPGGTLDTQRLLRARDFAALARRIEEAQHRFEADARTEVDYLRVLGAFDSADPALTPLLDAWLAASPDAWPARLARATHFNAVAWRRRGGNWSRETSEDQQAGLRDFLRKSVEDTRAALAREPKLAPAYRLLISAAMAVGDNEACLRIAGQGLTVAPASLRIRTRLATCLLPRWGGSYEALTALGREAAMHVKENPALAALAGWVDWDRATLAKSEKHYDEAIKLFTRALEAGEYWEFYEERAEAYYHQKRYTETLADVARAMATVPEDPGLLVLRAQTVWSLGRPEDAVTDLRLATELDPTDNDVVSFRNFENERAAWDAAQALERKDTAGAIRRLTIAIDMTGGSGEVFYRRGRAYLALSDMPHALGDFEEAIRLDPRHFESYRNVDYILARQGDWDGIIERWTRYIELEPMSGPALLERGGARHHKGDEQNARADLRKACGLGATEACELEKRLGG